MRFRVQDDCRGISHAGRQFTPTGNGTIELDAGAANAVAPHGLVPAGEALIEKLSLPPGSDPRNEAQHRGTAKNKDPRGGRRT